MSIHEGVKVEETTFKKLGLTLLNADVCAARTGNLQVVRIDPTYAFPETRIMGLLTDRPMARGMLASAAHNLTSVDLNHPLSSTYGLKNDLTLPDDARKQLASDPDAINRPGSYAFIDDLHRKPGWVKETYEKLDSSGEFQLWVQALESHDGIDGQLGEIAETRDHLPPFFRDQVIQMAAASEKWGHKFQNIPADSTPGKLARIAEDAFAALADGHRDLFMKFKFYNYGTPHGSPIILDPVTGFIKVARGLYWDEYSSFEAPDLVKFKNWRGMEISAQASPKDEGVIWDLIDYKVNAPAEVIRGGKALYALVAYAIDAKGGKRFLTIEEAQGTINEYKLYADTGINPKFMSTSLGQVVLTGFAPRVFQKWKPEDSLRPNEDTNGQGGAAMISRSSIYGGQTLSDKSGIAPAIEGAF